MQILDFFSVTHLHVTVAAFVFQRERGVSFTTRRQRLTTALRINIPSVNLDVVN